MIVPLFLLLCADICAICGILTGKTGQNVFGVLILLFSLLFVWFLFLEEKEHQEWINKP